MSVCSRGSAGLISPPNGRAFGLLLKSSSHLGGDRFLKRDSRAFPSGVTLSNSRIETSVQLPLFPADSPAHPTVAPGSDAAQRILVTSGRRWRESYDRSSPLGCVVKTLLERWPWCSIRRLLIWKLKVTPYGLLYFRLSPWGRGTNGSGSLSWPTLTARDGDPRGSGWNQSPSLGATARPSLYLAARLGIFPVLPTLRANDAKGSAYQRDRGQKGKERLTLCGLLPTLLARDQRCLSSAAPRPRARGGPNLVMVSGGKLNADWCEWYMGFPVGWTDIGADELWPSEIPVYPNRSIRS